MRTAVELLFLSWDVTVLALVYYSRCIFPSPKVYVYTLAFSNVQEVCNQC